MFVLKQSPTFSWPVRVSIPTDGGRYQVETFDAMFKRPTQTRVLDTAERVKAGALGDREFAREVLTGWSGVTNDGAEVPFSDSALQQLLDVPGAAAAVVRAYYEALAGGLEKN